MNIEPRFATSIYPGLKSLGGKKLLTIFFGGVSVIGLTTLASTQIRGNDESKFEANLMSVSGLGLTIIGGIGLVVTRVWMKEEKEGPY